MSKISWTNIKPNKKKKLIHTETKKSKYNDKTFFKYKNNGNVIKETYIF